ncbi:MAG: ABC transporter ATP-binding protein, partial [Kiloniellaceae bacterium]
MTAAAGRIARSHRHAAGTLPQAESAQPLLQVRGLSVRFQTDAGALQAVDGVDLDLHPGETLAIVGESGSGKSVLSLALMGLLPGIATVTAERLQFAGRDLRSLAPRDWQRLRGREMSMIFQEPATALNPVRSVGAQIVEAIRLHEKVSRKAAWARAVDMLRQTGIPAPERRAAAYPHELSGGMRQRAMIAMSLVLRPSLLIADEPTTALDVTVQAQILDLLRGLARESGTAILIITHDL